MTVRSTFDQVAARPVLRNNALNGKPVMSFDGIDDNLQNSINYAIPYTVFVVAHYNGPSPRGRILSGTSTNWLLGWHGGYFDRFLASSWVSSLSPITDDSWVSYAGDNTSTVQRLFRNNQSVTTSTLTTTLGPRGLLLGSYNGILDFSICEVAEVIVYNRVLSNSERQAIFQYLNARYNLY